MTAVDAFVIASASAFGSRLVPSEEVDHAFGMPSGKLKSRAGIHSFAHAAENEDEGSLGVQACRQVLHNAAEKPEELDWILAASETHHAYPSLSAILHARLHLRENCNALDVGSGCLALLQAFAVAQALLVSGRAKKILVATADVHSRTLGPGRAAGEFGGLFGDGASAFLVSTKLRDAKKLAYRLGEFFFGCASKYADAIAISDAGGGRLDVQFNGDALSRAAVNRMEKVIHEVEHRSGISRDRVGAFATHQPNPRLVKLLAKQLGVSAKHFPPIGTTRGNLGSSMCGAALHDALHHAAAQSPEHRQPVFLASLGPGLLFGGGWMVPAGA
ncbi:MAG TPA: 3-oxoacyl-[acyl-carrier-protein] synthase III C-terminal domain-containing protein [Candidatus Limnocylindrales bacterium]|nr:3-oxoacyl-[acyl-carrier-protein] synthase III C-terminal domain-containing protein [Candidatus Limnocylindrales bacterium]